MNYSPLPFESKITSPEVLLARVDDRVALFASLESVTLATSFDEDTPLRRILDCHADILANGDDCTAEKRNDH